MKIASVRLCLGFIINLALLSVSAAGNGEEEHLAEFFGDKDFVSIATGARQPALSAPAVTTVITAAEIKNMGARDLDEVLEAVPGLHVAYSPIGYNPIYVLRGIYSEFNPEVLVLINGIPVTNLFAGNRSQAWGGMPVLDIARIEIIRGPGSALYGADAFAGVINIVSKTRADIDGIRTGARAGSFDTQEAWMLYGGDLGDIQAALSLQVGTSAGQRETISADAQSGLDVLFGTAASLAPGPVNVQRDSLDARIDLGLERWRLRAGYQDRNNLGTGAGVAQALDPRGDLTASRFNADIGYRDPLLSRDWQLEAQLSYFRSKGSFDPVLFPPGAFGGSFPLGVIGTPALTEDSTRLDLSSAYTGFHSHKLRFGLGYYIGNLAEASESKNFDATLGAVPIPLAQGLIDVSNDPGRIFIQPHTREASYFYAQDEWAFASDWIATAGVRYDRYSDFGETVNPRLALVWQARYDLTGKLLLGRAFRAPSFQELFNINNPVAVGNPNLDPATLQNVELAFNYEPTDSVTTALNVFRYETDGDIRFVADPGSATTATARNNAGQKGYGLESEVKWGMTRDVTLTANYAFHHATDKETGSDVGNSPRQQFYARSDWAFAPTWLLATQLNTVLDRRRAGGDVRPDIDDYSTVDMTLRTKLNRLELAISVRNLFDADARVPSPAPGLIPDDLPLPGRSLYLEIRTRLM